MPYLNKYCSSLPNQLSAILFSYIYLSLVKIHLFINVLLLNCMSENMYDMFSMVKMSEFINDLLGTSGDI